MQGYYEVMKSIGVFLLACFFEVGGRVSSVAMAKGA